MTSQNVTAPSTGDLGPFLYSDVAVERTGMELTLLSALARQGLDPWKEAERLASLPRPVATSDLSAKLATLGLPNGTALAVRLMGLLPKPAAVPARRVPELSRSLSPGWLMAAVVAGVLSGFLVTPQKPAATVAPASWFSEPAPAKDIGHAKPARVNEANKEAPASTAAATAGQDNG